MTEVAFHFNVPDKPAYLCRLLRKVVLARRRAVVCGPTDLLNLLDQGLWTISAEDFISHARADAPLSVRHRSAVVLAEQPPADQVQDVLINCWPDVPQRYGQYARLIEVVGLDDTDRAQARGRWKYYVAQGVTPLRHDLAVKGA